MSRNVPGIEMSASHVGNTTVDPGQSGGDQDGTPADRGAKAERAHPFPEEKREGGLPKPTVTDYLPGRSSQAA
jgi:hypothetical protein